jgi:hypothetical protein
MSAPSDRELALFWKPLPNGYEVIVYPIYGGARVCYGRLDEPACIDDAFYYENPTLAIVAAQLWDGDGDPIDGWFRHLKSDRRREHGDPHKERIGERR